MEKDMFWYKSPPCTIHLLLFLKAKKPPWTRISNFHPMCATGSIKARHGTFLDSITLINDMVKDIIYMISDARLL